MSESQPKTGKRAAFYIDGFNLYHPIDEAGDHYLKWVNLWKLSELICAQEGCQLVKVVFCTAVPAHLPDKRDRHNLFNAAQKHYGVDVIKGHHVFEVDKGKYSEKQSDINVALCLILDGIDDKYDIAYLVSADSDQVATARVFNDRLAPLGKQFIGVAPMNRQAPQAYLKHGIVRRAISRFQLDQCVMDEHIPTPSGRTIVRPQQYAPPAGWIPFSHRPKTKTPKAPKKGAWSKAFKAR